MEQLRIKAEMAKHSKTTHHTMDKRYACDDSRVLGYDHDGSGEPSNRLSAPEYGGKKLTQSNSLTDLSTGDYFRS